LTFFSIFRLPSNQDSTRQ